MRKIYKEQQWLRWHYHNLNVKLTPWFQLFVSKEIKLLGNGEKKNNYTANWTFNLGVNGLSIFLCFSFIFQVRASLKPEVPSPFQTFSLICYCKIKRWKCVMNTLVNKYNNYVYQPVHCRIGCKYIHNYQFLYAEHMGSICYSWYHYKMYKNLYCFEIYYIYWWT